MSHTDTDALQEIRGSELGHLLSSRGLTMEMLRALPAAQQDRALEVIHRAVRRLPIEQLRALDLSNRFEEQLETVGYLQALHDEHVVTVEAQRREIEVLRSQLGAAYHETAKLQVELENRAEALGALALAASLIREHASPVDDERWGQVLNAAYACGASSPVMVEMAEDPAPEFRPFAEMSSNVIYLPPRRQRGKLRSARPYPIRSEEADMSFSRRKKWEDMPSSGDLAKLMGCEREFVLERETGVESSDPTRRARAKAGQAAHLHAQEQMEAFHNKGAQDSRCVVASAVYGHDAPETDELRDFRDQSLLPTAAGRAVVKGYYRVSPPIAQFLESHPRAAAPVRKILDGFRRTLST